MIFFHSNKPRPSLTNCSAGKRQQGVAIITALLIVTIAATVSITISTRLQLDVRRTSNLIALDQADFYLLEAEKWSQQILRDDKKNSNIDSLDEDWAIEIPALPVEGGTIQGKLVDLQSCINVNALIDHSSGSTDPITLARLNQLFTNAQITTNLTQAIADWIDDDLDRTNPDGAEDGHYTNLEKPYRTANTLLHSISELRLIRGFEDTDTYNSVKDHLCAFVPDGSVGINVNTASSEVLLSLSPSMTSALAKDIMDRQQNNPFTDLKDFTSLSNLKTIIPDTGQLTVSSHYFLLVTQAIIGKANKVMYSIIYRNDAGDTSIISRTQRTL